MGKKIGIILGLLVLCLGYISAQSFGSVDNDKQDEDIIVDSDRGFAAQADIDTNLFQWSGASFQDEKDRNYRTDYSLIDNYPFGGFNILDDTNVSFAYNGSWYGGGLALSKNGLGSIKAWLSFWDGKFKITAGSDIGYSYADSQGADAGLRVYDDNVRNTNEGAKENESIDTSKNPDNITRDQGLLLEFNLHPLKIALAGGGNISDISKNMGTYMSASNSEAVYGHSLHYGLNVGSKIGEIAKLNGSYILQSEKDATKYEYVQLTDEIVARQADAEITTHLFGVYGTVYPFKNDTLGITLGYAGVFIQYLEEFSTQSKTAMPQIFKNGINLTARYKTNNLTIKTDHNFSFWQDRNYRIYNLYKPLANIMRDYGLMPSSDTASDVSDVTHTFLWNGIGASYKFTPVVEGSVYIRNLIRIDETQEYKMMNDYFSLELKSTFYLGPNVEAYAGITYHYTGRTASEELATAVDEFRTGNTPKETVDSLNMIQIPIGFRVKLQK